MTRKALDRALRDGTLNNKTHTDCEIQELKDSGVYAKRYNAYFDRDMYHVEDIEEGIKEWAQEYLEKVCSCHDDTCTDFCACTGR